jgi:hypothetical protein
MGGMRAAIRAGEFESYRERLLSGAAPYQ